MNDSFSADFSCSPTIGALAAALAKAQAQGLVAGKDGRNSHFKSRYATLDNILVNCLPVLGSMGLSVTQMPVGRYRLMTILMHSSGEYIASTYEMDPVKKDPQGCGSLFTYMRRYAFCAIVGVSLDDDDDGNSVSNISSNKASDDQDSKRAETIRSLARSHGYDPKALLEASKGMTLEEVRSKLKIKD